MMLYKVVRRFQPVNNFLNCDHLKTPLNEIYWLLSCGDVCYAA